jgi:hypothetical protein
MLASVVRQFGKPPKNKIRAGHRAERSFPLQSKGMRFLRQH